MGAFALPYGFSAVPVMNVNKYDFKSFLGFSCRYVDSVYWQVLDDPDYYADKYAAFMDQIRDPIGVALELPSEVIEKANFIDLESYYDIISCKRFEGQPMEWTFTDETWHLVSQMTAIRQSEALKGENLNLYMWKVTRDPLDVLQYKVDRMLGRVA